MNLHVATVAEWWQVVPKRKSMTELSVLLIQVRDPSDPMATHELGCVERRLADRAVRLVARNAIAERPDASWLQGVHALIVGGSGAYSVHHPRSQRWVSPLRRLLDVVLERGLPGFGICFGHQLMGYHLGAAVNTDQNHAELGTIRLHLTPEGKRDSLFGGLGAVFSAHTGHSDHVDGTPAGVELLASGDQLTTQAFKVRDAPFYSTQFHPDLTGQEAASRYVAFHASRPDHGDADPAELASHFQPGQDASARLLGLFVDLVAQSAEF